MKKVLLLLSLMLILAGCVSTKTFESAVDESEARRHTIEKITRDLNDKKRENEILKEEISTLKARIEEARGENNSITAALNEKDTRIEFLTGEVERLTNEIARLSSVKEQKEKEIAEVKSTYENLMGELKQEIEKGEIKITRAMDRLSVNLVEEILFDSGKAEIKPEGKDLLKRVGGILSKVTEKQIKVEGHTDDVPIGPRLKKKFPTNWELSAARATNVVRYLQDTAGVDPKLLSASGYSKFRPVVENDTEEGRSRNRRIEIVLLPLDIDRVLEELKK
ncbi:MAG: OmpA family protein [Thermodesulfobacteriota bacterium]|nr:MAG: OmpA family protein [Thermodesulfobacteriota bacterium]